VPAVGDGPQDPPKGRLAPPLPLGQSQPEVRSILLTLPMPKGKGILGSTSQLAQPGLRQQE
jgi:hypothetical protein